MTDSAPPLRDGQRLAEEAEVRSRRQGLIRTIFWATLGFGLPAVALGSLRAFEAGEPRRAVVFVAGFLILAAALGWRRAPYGLQVNVIVGVLFAVAVHELGDEGLSSVGRIVLLTAVGMAALLMTRRAAFAVLALAVATLIAFAWLHTSGGIDVPMERLANSTDVGEWISAVFVFVLMAVMLSASQTYLIPTLTRALSRAQSLTLELRDTVREKEDLVSVQQAVFEATGDGILVVDREGQAVTYNEQVAAMWSLPFEVLEAGDDRRMLEIAKTQLKDPDSFMSGVTALYENPEATSRDILELNDGRIYERHSQPHRLGDEIVGRVWTFRDTTARLRAERDLQLLNRELEARVRSRTAELETFAYTVAHDLRAPLRGINGFSQLLAESLEQELSPSDREYFHRIRAATVRMDSLIDALLRLSRISRHDLSLEEVDLTELTREVVSELPSRYPDHEVEVVIEEGLTARGDPELLGRLLDELLDNAWKFTRGQPNPRVELHHIGFEDGGVFAVVDNGIGFDMKHASVLFKPFWSAHGAEETGAFTGIGLAVARRIVQRHNGSIWAEAEAGAGASIFFSL